MEDPNVHPPPSIANYDMSHGCQCSIPLLQTLMVYKDGLILIAFAIALHMSCDYINYAIIQPIITSRLDKLVGHSLSLLTALIKCSIVLLKYTDTIIIPPTLVMPLIIKMTFCNNNIIHNVTNHIQPDIIYII